MSGPYAVAMHRKKLGWRYWCRADGLGFWGDMSVSGDAALLVTYPTREVAQAVADSCGGEVAPAPAQAVPA